MRDHLQQSLGYQFTDPNLLTQALTHKSFANEQRTTDNERLEFLGDSVLQLVISHELVRRYPRWSEGLLSKFRAVLVSESGLSQLARQLNLGPHLLIGKGEEAGNGRDKASILANAMEALFAAIYLDAGAKGFKAVQKTILTLVTPQMDAQEESFAYDDVKTDLQEWVQRFKLGEISYQLLSETGPDHEKHFVMGLEVNGKLVGKGEGKNKKTAEQQAAFHALKALKQAPAGA